jgi:hypothetical protein
VVVVRRVQLSRHGSSSSSRNDGGGGDTDRVTHGEKMRVYWNTAWNVSIAILGFCSVAMLSIGPTARAQQTQPTYQHDPNWPKPLPARWALGGITGMFVDHEDHIWVLHRPRDLAFANNVPVPNPPPAAPAVLEFDVDGNLLTAWGVPNMVPGWPLREHTIFVDRQRNVFIAGSEPGDSILKFTRDGRFISDFGHRGPVVPLAGQSQQNQQTDLLLRGVAGATLDEDAHELYIADGYLNRRVLVYDSDTGRFKRGWGAYGIALSEIPNDPQPPYDPTITAKQFSAPVHCVMISRDSLVYVCDRAGNRVQVFTKDGKFQKELFVSRETLMRGTAGSVSFSPDQAQQHIFVADMANQSVWMLNRQTGAVVQRIGGSGRGPGESIGAHVAATDSKGNLYAGEVGGRRVLKFSPVGH